MRRFVVIASLILAIFACQPASAAVAIMSSQQQTPPQQPVPFLGNAGNTVTFTSGGSAVVVDSGITVGCSCSTITGGTVTISSGYLALDVLAATTTGTSITASFNTSTGILTLSGADSIANYQTVLQSVTYNSTATDPTNNGADNSRTVSWVLSNAAGNSTAVTSTVVVQNSARPVINNAGNTVSYTAQGAAVTLDPAITISCTCANLTGGTISISTGFFANDSLNFTNQLGITGSYNGSSGVLTLSGTTTVANYQTALASITYTSSVSDPTNGGAFPTKTVLWVVANGGTSSFPVPTTTVNITLPGQPSWAPSGSSFAVNGQTNQCWINGVGTQALATCLQTTRNSTESCITGASTVTAVGPNVACTGANGMSVLDSYTNYVTQSVDLSNSVWLDGGGGYTTGSGTLSIVGNSVIAPDGTTTAAKIVANRTSAGDNAQYINNTWQDGATGTYSAGLWLKADGSGDVGKQVSLHFFDAGGAARDFTVTLTAVWQFALAQNFQFDSCTSHSGSNCQFGVGYTSSGGTNNTGVVNFDAWGAEFNAGTVTFPFVRTAGSSVTTVAENIQFVSGSTPETVLSGAASSVFITTFGGINGSTAATLLDSNGTVWLGQANTAAFTTALGSSLSTVGSANWSQVQVPALARNASGRTMAVSRLSVYAKDTQATTVSTPIHVGSTSGTSAFFNGYIQLIVGYNSRVADSAIGVSGAGTCYYVSAAGSDANSGTDTCGLSSTSNAWASINKVNAGTYVTNDKISFRGGDTFTGCLVMTGGANWQATASAPGTITSYGTGHALITPNCTGTNNRVGAVQFKHVDGMIYNGVDVTGDTAGNASICIYVSNADGNAHGTLTIENATLQGCHNTTVFFGGMVFFDSTGNSGGYNHINVLNNTMHGATPTSTDADNGITGFGCTNCWSFDNIQGNLIYNIGGLAGGVNGSEGNGILVTGAGLATVLNNVVHDFGSNTTTCGGPAGIWAFGSNHITFNANEAYNGNYASGCDGDGFDADGSTQTITFEYNYSHNNAQGGFFAFVSGTWGPTIYRYNISIDDALKGANQFSMSNPTNASGIDIYNNTIIRTPTGGSSSAFLLGLTGNCGGAVFAANNILASYKTGQNDMIGWGQNGSTRCTGGTLLNNVMYAPNASGGLPFYCEINGSSFISSGTFANCITNITNAGATVSSNQNINPTFTSTPTTPAPSCNSTTGPGATNCPSGYTLGGGSALKNAGTDLTQSPYNRTVGTQDFYGVAIPTGTGTGYPIGASN